LKILITGAGGLVGRALTKHANQKGDKVATFDHRSLDISDADAVREILQSTHPQVVINCAAWTDVDGCESDPEHARRANAVGPELLAHGCREIDALFITISTDYVFDGTKKDFYTQKDQPNPISVYGKSKLEGERRAQAAWARTIVVRSGYIFGVGGTNFLSTVVERVRTGASLKVIYDMIGTPTYARDLAARLHELAELNLPGVFHAVNDGDGASFYDFAQAAVELAGYDNSNIERVSLADLNRPAPRPRDSRLKCLLSPAVGLEPLPNWRDGLRNFVAEQLTSAESAAGADS
jgi:dTDP-4-dehydrorhamnose reductase